MSFSTLSNYHLSDLIDDAMFVCLLDELILGFCYIDLTLETGEFELASTITLVLQPIITSEPITFHLHLLCIS